MAIYIPINEEKKKAKSILANVNNEMKKTKSVFGNRDGAAAKLFEYVPEVTDRFLTGNNSNSTYSYSENGENWILKDCPDCIASDTYFKSICYGKGMFVASLSNGIMVYSVNGEDWLEGAALPDGNAANAVCYGKDEFIAACNTQVYGSTDGINWTLKAAIPALTTASGACFLNGRYIILGAYYYNGYQRPYFCYSEDGTTWTPWYNTGISKHIWLYNACYANGIYVLSGLGFVYYTSDLTTVTASNYNNQSHQVSKVLHNGTRFFGVINSTGYHLESADGKTWTLVSDNSTCTFSDVIYVDGKFYAVNPSHGIFSSTDMVQWTQVVDAVNSGKPNKICYGQI